MSGERFTVRFWGVRGSIACAGPETLRYGGNTSSLEVRCGDRLVLFDAGSGIRYLGNRLHREAPIDADLYLTHTHFDHVCGLPFFRPLNHPDNATGYRLEFAGRSVCYLTDTEHGWGHSTWQEAVRLCRAAGAKRPFVFHHDPDHDDDTLDAIAKEVEAQLPGSILAREGLELSL